MLSNYPVIGIPVDETPGFRYEPRDNLTTLREFRYVRYRPGYLTYVLGTFGTDLDIIPYGSFMYDRYVDQILTGGYRYTGRRNTPV